MLYSTITSKKRQRKSRKPEFSALQWIFTGFIIGLVLGFMIAACIFTR